MSVDFIFIILLAWFTIKGYKKGIVRASFSTIAVFVGMIGALKLSHLVAKYLFNTRSDINPWVPLLSYLIVFVTIVFIINRIASMIDTGLRTVRLGWANKLAGAVLYGLILTFVWSSVLWLADKVNLINPDLKANSTTYSIIEPVAPKGFEIIGNLLPVVKSSFEGLNNIFDKVNNTAS